MSKTGGWEFFFSIFIYTFWIFFCHLLIPPKWGDSLWWGWSPWVKHTDVHYTYGCLIVDFPGSKNRTIIGCSSTIPDMLPMPYDIPAWIQLESLQSAAATLKWRNHLGEVTFHACFSSHSIDIPMHRHSRHALWHSRYFPTPSRHVQACLAKIEQLSDWATSLTIKQEWWE